MRISFGLMDVITSRDIILQNLCHRQNLKSFWMHSKGRTEIISENPLDEEKVKEAVNAKVKEAVNATGYQVLSVKSEPYEKKGFSLFHKK